MEFKNYKMEDIATFSQGKQVEIENQYTEKKENMRRFLRIIDFTNPNEPIRYVEDFGDRYYAKKDDLVMIRYGSQTCGKVVIGKEGIIANNMFKINLDNSIVLNRYAYYYLKQDIVYNYLRGSQNSSTMPSINFGILNKLEIEVPSIDNQRKIVKILNDIDEKIDLNNQINNNLYEFTNKLFEEKVLNNQDKEHWTEYVLSDISKMINGYSYKGNELTDKSDIGMATIKNFERTGGFKLDGFKDIIPEKAKDDHYVKPYEVLVACTDLTQNADIIGNAIMLLNISDYKEIIMSMDLVKLVPITDFINNYMLYAMVNSKDFKDFALAYKSGTTVLHLNKNCFKEYTIKLPNEDILKDLSKVIEVNYKKISQIIEENKKLEQLRDALLPKLMNGDIDLDNVEI